MALSDHRKGRGRVGFKNDWNRRFGVFSPHTLLHVELILSNWLIL